MTDPSVNDTSRPDSTAHGGSPDAADGRERAAGAPSVDPPRVPHPFANDPADPNNPNETRERSRKQLRPGNEG